MIDFKTLRSLIQGKKVLIDSNVIIYLTERTEPYYRLSRELFSMIEEGICQSVISILSVTEVMQGTLRAGKKDTAMAVKNYLVNFPNSYCQNINPDVLDRVGMDERVDWNVLRAVDSLIIASGLQAEADLFISNDRHFMKALPPEMLLTFLNHK
jgi:predicted nucleic acid-binding protein